MRVLCGVIHVCVCVCVRALTCEGFCQMVDERGGGGGKVCVCVFGAAKIINSFFMLHDRRCVVRCMIFLHADK